MREVEMAVEEARERLRQQLEEDYGVEGAGILMDRPPGGWSDLVTKDYLDARLEALENKLRVEIVGVRTEVADLRTQLERQTTSLLRWLVPTVFAAIVVASRVG
jgi:hypothetical protein